MPRSPALRVMLYWMTMTAAHGPTRIDRYDIIFIALAVAAFAGILFLGRSLTFYHDDWRYIDERLDWSLGSFLEPHNQHWTLMLALLWKPLLVIVGLDSYLPYLALNAFAHILIAGAIYWCVRRLADPAAGLVAGILMLTLGASGELLFHGQGAHLIIATAFGAWAFVLTVAADPPRTGLVALLLLLGVASGGPGLFFVVAVVTYLVFVPGRLRDLLSVVPATVVYAIWYVAYGREDSVPFRGAVGELIALWEWVRVGTAAAVGSAVGIGPEIGLVLFVILVVATLWQLLGRGPYPYIALAALAGLAAQNIVTGIARIHLQEGNPADAPRYAHTGAVFVLVALAAWYGSRPRPRPMNSMPLVAIAAAVVILNLQGVRWWADSWYTVRSQETRAAISVALEHGGTLALPGDRWPLHPSDPFISDIPSPDRLREIISVLGGDPLDDAWQPGTYPIPTDVYERIEAEMLGASAPATD